ncbi:MAG: phage tail protein [Chloroflexota bacterium]
MPTAKRKDPVMGYNFLVSLNESSSQLATVVIGVLAPPQAGFSECSGLEMSLQVEEYREGGNNGTVLKFPTRAAFGNIRLRRGLAISDDLWKWHYSFVQGKGKRRDGMIILQNDRHEPVRVWRFVRGLPVKWSGPTLSAGQSQVAIEELEIAHEGLSVTSAGAVGLISEAVEAVGSVLGL